MIACNSSIASGFLLAATNCSTNFNCNRIRSDPLGAASICSRNEVRLSGEALFSFAAAVDVSLAGSSLGLPPGFSVAWLPVDSACFLRSVSTPSVGSMELLLEGSTAWLAFVWLVGSPGFALASTRRGRDFLAVDDELDACLGFFLLEFP